MSLALSSLVLETRETDQGSRLLFRAVWLVQCVQAACHVCAISRLLTRPGLARRLKGEDVQEGDQKSTYGIEVWAGEVAEEMDDAFTPCENR